MIKKPAILIVEDNTLNLVMEKKILSSLDCDIHGVNTGEEGLEIAAREDELFLIVVDIRLAGMTGFEMINQLRKIPQKRETAIIIVTSTPKLKNGHRHEIKGVDYFYRPVAPNVLLDRAQYYLDLHQKKLAS